MAKLVTKMVGDAESGTFKHGRSGYSKHRCRCDVCRKGAADYKRAYHAANPEKRMEEDRKYRMKDPEGLRARARARYASNAGELEHKREYKAANLEKLTTYVRRYHEEHREEEARYHRARYESNPVRSKVMTRKWREAHREHFREWCRIYQKARREDPLYRLEMNVRGRVHKALRRGLKSIRSMELVGCSVSELKTYLERKFKPGMTWENYGHGGWHVDHIKPCSEFDLAVPKQRVECFHWSNLQPLWAWENMAKSDKWAAA